MTELIVHIIIIIYLVYTTQMNSAFSFHVPFISEHQVASKTLKIDHFSVNCFRTDKVIFGMIYSTCVVYTKIIIIHLGVSE